MILQQYKADPTGQQTQSKTDNNIPWKMYAAKHTDDRHQYGKKQEDNTDPWHEIQKSTGNHRYRKDMPAGKGMSLCGFVNQWLDIQCFIWPWQVHPVTK